MWRIALSPTHLTPLTARTRMKQMETAGAEDPDDAISKSDTSETLLSTPELYSGAVSRDLFTEPSEANDPDPPPLNLETQRLKKPWYQSSLDTNQPKPQRESAAIKFLQKAFKQTGPKRSKLMKTIPALQYYRFRVLHLQHHYWNLVDLDLSSPAR